MNLVTMTKTTAVSALLVLSPWASAACTASTVEPYPALQTEGATVTESAPVEILGTWQFTTVQGSVSSWTFEPDGKVTHVVAVVSGPSECRRTETTTYEGTVRITDRTLEYTATRASETTVDCTGSVSSPGRATPRRSRTRS